MRITIRQIEPLEIANGAAVIAKTIAGNPLHVAAFGTDTPAARTKQQRMFEYVLAKRHTVTYVAVAGATIAGVMCYTPHQHCQLTPPGLITTLPKMAFNLGRSLLPVLRWQKKWGSHDPMTLHVHFGPLAVDPSFQGQGIGSLLLRHFCSYLDETKQIGYLETDKAANVTLYQRFGFREIESDIVIGVTNWFMERKLSFC